MKSPWLAAALCLAFTPTVLADALFDFYQHLHANPKLSHFETKTAALLATELRKAGFQVTTDIGKYKDGSQAHGVVAVLENGAGPRLLIRADMDALPIVEETNLPYASKVTSTNAAGQQVGVMHACGHARRPHHDITRYRTRNGGEA